MTRRRYVYRNGVAHEVGLDYSSEPSHVADSALWNDRLYQDDGDKRYNSRTQHQAYMRDNGLSTMDDYTDTWAKAEKARKSELAGIDPSRKHDVIEAFQRVREKNHHG
jgi:hypothetical protein